MVNFRPPPPPEPNPPGDLNTENVGTQTNFSLQSNIGTQTSRINQPLSQHQVTQTLRANVSDSQTQTVSLAPPETHIQTFEGQTQTRLQEQRAAETQTAVVDAVDRGC